MERPGLEDKRGSGTCVAQVAAVFFPSGAWPGLVTCLLPPPLGPSQGLLWASVSLQESSFSVFQEASGFLQEASVLSLSNS